MKREENHGDHAETAKLRHREAGLAGAPLVNYGSFEMEEISGGIETSESKTK